MKWLGKPDIWFVLGLLLLAAAGTVLLIATPSTELDARAAQFYWSRHYWQSAFDGLSAACGVGLLTRGFDADYTPLGRWLLTATGLAGAVLYLLAAASVVRRLRSAHAGGRLLHPVGVVLLFLMLQLLLTPLVWLVDRLAGTTADLAGAAWRVTAAFSSLGWVQEPLGERAAWTYAVVAFLGGVGWLGWLFLLPQLRRRYVYAPTVLALVAGYVAFLLGAATLLWALETPRAGRDTAAGDSARAAQSAKTRYARCVAQTVCASAAGIPSEEGLRDRADRGMLTDGSKVTLAVVVLVGGLGGAAGGGIKWPLLLWALSGGALVLGRPRCRTAHAATIRYVHAGSTCLVLLVGLAVLVALGLLWLENNTASPFQQRPTFADAFLDASSAVAGANLSSGLTATVTGENLSSGMRQSVDQYQYGMVWLMLAMLIGRTLPLLVLRRLADTEIGDAPWGTPPLV
ncbi:MAG: hypothetical protein KKB50_02545 [Planctomycetes bacterium]|nr:hypothetical protein [Planctomycetota bacterium]